MKSRNAVLIAVPIAVIATLGILVIAPSIVAQHQLANYHDKTGYQPEWVRGLTVDEIMDKCATPPDGDSDWCVEFGWNAIAQRIRGTI